MPQILMVHGMNVGLRSREAFESRWFGALVSNLRATFGDELELPTEADCKLLYWSDLIPPFSEWVHKTKGLLDELEAVGAAGLRRLLLERARHTEFSLESVKQWQEGLRKRLEQTVLYMENVAGLQDEVMRRFDALLSDQTCLVIGHSLGSVIAYQGLVRFPHRVSTLLTVGSPLGTPRLVYERLAPHDWPNVARWHNVSAVADVWSVPTPELKGLFRGPIVDLQVRHGHVYDPKTHRLDRYLRHREVLNEIIRTWNEAKRQS